MKVVFGGLPRQESRASPRGRRDERRPGGKFDDAEDQPKLDLPDFHEYDFEYDVFE